MEPGYYQSPTLHNDTIVFVCEDDLWTVSAAGGIARRLTANPGDVSSPALSPDGTLLAFTGRDEGEREVYVMPALGGPATRLTYLGVNSRVVGWLPNGRIIFASNHGQFFSRVFEIYALDPQGGEIAKLPTGPALSLSVNAEGGMVIGRNTTDLASWKRYRGGLSGNIWIDAQGSGDWQRLVDLPGNVAQPLWLGERVYFVSDHEGIGNLYSCTAAGEDLQRHTHHSDFYVRHPATDGRRIVYHAGADLFLFDPETHESTPVAVEFYSPRVQRKRRFVDTGYYLEHENLHPQGHSMAIITRGKPFHFALWEGAVTHLGETDGVRYRLATWLHNGSELALVSDASGEERLEVHAADGSAVQTFAKLDIGRPWEMAASPTDRRLALSNHRQELILVDLDSGEMTVVDRSPYQAIHGLDWSPDGQWLAYGFSATAQTSCLRLYHLPSGETHTITRPVLRDLNPSFDPDGKYLYFLSYRTFDPIRDNVQFDLTFPWGMRPYLITLQAELPSPFVPTPRAPGDKPDDDDAADDRSPAAQTQTDAGEEGEAAAESDPENQSADADSETPPLRIDLEGIEKRVLAFPVSQAIYKQVRGIKGKVLFSTTPLRSTLSGDDSHGPIPAARTNLHMYDFESQNRELVVGEITHFDLSLDRKTLVYRAADRLRVLKAGDIPSGRGGGPSRKTGWLDLDRVRVSVLPAQEWRQMFRDAWRWQRDHFWTADMSGVDWQVVFQRYLPLIDRVATRTEFSDLMWEMQGELGTSHAYEIGGDYRPEPHYAQGFLGADFVFDEAANAYRLTNIVPGDVWDETASSPLARPGLGVDVGDYLLAINGRSLGRDLSPAMALVNQARQMVSLTIRSAAADAEPRTLNVKALDNEFEARYRAWVDANRRMVHEATDGRVGYLHIPDMDAEGYAEFHRGYLAEVDREGLIVDVRFNTGGSISSLLLEKLARRRLGYDVSRWGQPLPYPPESVWGPLVALCNEQSASDGDMFSHAFKLMQLGPLIGTRTWGGVIGIWPRNMFVDGGFTTQPEFSFYFADVGWRVENYGTEPDIEVEQRPQDAVAGQDRQLQRAIEVVLQRLTDEPPQLPHFDDRPLLSLPRLPG